MNRVAFSRINLQNRFEVSFNNDLHFVAAITARLPGGNMAIQLVEIGVHSQMLTNGINVPFAHIHAKYNQHLISMHGVAVL